MVLSRKDVKALVSKIEEILNSEIALLPSRPAGAGKGSTESPAGAVGQPRVLYVPLPGTGSRFQLSPRAQQVFSFLKRSRRASPQDLQTALKVNRNVIAGAVHELKAKQAIRIEHVEGGNRRPAAVAAEYAYGKRRAKIPRPRRRPK